MSHHEKGKEKKKRKKEELMSHKFLIHWIDCKSSNKIMNLGSIEGCTFANQITLVQFMETAYLHTEPILTGASCSGSSFLMVPPS